MAFDGSSLIGGVAFNGSGLIRGVTFGGSCFIRGGGLWWEWPDNRGTTILTMFVINLTSLGHLMNTNGIIC